MNENELRTLRLSNQQLLTHAIKQPEDLVRWFGAVQAQDYYGSLWGMGLRLENAAESLIELAISERKIVRSWPMRGTLHFTLAEDLQWMLKLLAERVERQAAFRYRQLGLDEVVFKKSKLVVSKCLENNKYLTRPQIYERLTAAGIDPTDQRGIHILAKLARDCVICFGFRDGKQQTFVLFDEWIPVSKKLTREESLATLAKRYFQSHGPATVQDFAWWSGLTMTDAKTGIEFIKKDFETAEMNEFTYWFSRPKQDVKISSQLLLLPSYDEYTVAYKDRNAILDSEHTKNNDTGNGIFHPPIIVDGEVVGLWKRAIKKTGVTVAPLLFRELTNNEQKLFQQASKDYAAFLKMELL